MSELPVTVNLDAYHGDSWTQTFRFLDGSTPHDLSAATVVGAAAPLGGTGAAQQLVVTLGAPGEITLSAPGIAAGVYTYDVQVTEADDDVSTWVRGQLVVTQDVAHA